MADGGVGDDGGEGDGGGMEVCGGKVGEDVAEGWEERG